MSLPLLRARKLYTARYNNISQASAKLIVTWPCLNLHRNGELLIFYISVVNVYRSANEACPMLGSEARRWARYIG